MLSGTICLTIMLDFFDSTKHFWCLAYRFVTVIRSIIIYIEYKILADFYGVILI